MRRTTTFLSAVACLILTGFATPLPALGAEPESDAELIAREKARAAVEAALEEYLGPVPDADHRIENTIDAAERLMEFGDDAVFFLANELEQELRLTYDFCAYALARISTPESEAALRRAMARADEAEGSFARVRKALAAWGLGVQGHAEVVDSLSAGKHKTAHYPMNSDTTLLEAVALQIGPASVPLLLAQLDRFAEKPDHMGDRTWTLRALRRVGDPAAVPRVIRLLREDSDRNMRREAARTLSTMGTTDAVSALFIALGDEDFTVRHAAALSLEKIRPAGKSRAIVERLGSESDPLTRGVLYRLLARTEGSRAVGALRKQWGRDDPKDRRHLVQALGLAGGGKSVSLLEKALSDADNSVAVHAAMALGRIGTDKAVDALIAALASANPTVLQMIVAELHRLSAVRAAPAIAERLVGTELAVEVTEHRKSIPIQKMAEALVALRHPEVLPDLRQGRQRQTQLTVTQVLDDAIRLLETLERNAQDRTRWIETARGPDRDLRLLAYGRLAEIGGGPSVKVLIERFDAVEPDEAVAILRALGSVDEPDSATLIERVLLTEEFDTVEARPLREMAAWSARRIGGPRMFELLRASVDRRKARNAKVLVYAAVAGREQALPLLETYRVPRMRYLGWMRGFEQEKLDAIARDIRAGRPLTDVDVAPERLGFR